MKEGWKKIRFFPDYEVSTRGRVRSRKRHKPRILRQHTVTRGDRRKTYLRVTLYNRGGSRHRRVHRLVAFAFVIRPPGTDSVNHINGKTHDNRAVNLEWTTKVENTKHAWRTGLMKRSVGARWRTKPKRRKSCHSKTTRSSAKRYVRERKTQRSFCR